MYGPLVDKSGGKLALLSCMLLSALFSFAFASAHSMVGYSLSWALLRASQPAGWVGIVKIAGAWVPPSRQGKVMAVLSLSFLVGDAAVRAVLAALLRNNANWRSVFVFSAAMCTLFALPGMLLLSNHPPADSIRSKPVPGSPSKSSEKKDKANVRGMMSNKAFLLVCALSFTYTIIRETFNTYGVSYMMSTGFSAEEASASSSLFPLFGAFSTVCTGYLVDRAPTKHKGLVVPVFSALLVVPLAILASWERPNQTAVVILLSVTGFLCIGPYTLFAGVFALDVGTPFGASATASSLIDAAGYVGAVTIMWISSFNLGYQTLFSILTLSAVAAILVGVVFWAIFGHFLDETRRKLEDDPMQVTELLAMTPDEQDGV